jgi:two-component system, OmpR family, copper resistance phosphate regulon response regulator CusR
MTVSRFRTILYIVVAIVSLAGLADAAYLTVQALTRETAVCGGWPDCFRVLGYLVKPFAFFELLARVRWLLRRAPAEYEKPSAHRRFGARLAATQAVRSGVPLNLTPKEFLLLAHLVRSAGEVVSRAEIAEHVWDIGFRTDTNVVEVVVRRLRAKVDDPFETKLVHTIRGVGYVLKAH